MIELVAPTSERMSQNGQLGRRPRPDAVMIDHGQRHDLRRQRVVAERRLRVEQKHRVVVAQRRFIPRYWMEIDQLREGGVHPAAVRALDRDDDLGGGAELMLKQRSQADAACEGVRVSVLVSGDEDFLFVCQGAHELANLGLAARRAARPPRRCCRRSSCRILRMRS